MRGCVCNMCVHGHLQRPEEDVRLPGAGVAGSCETLDMGAEY